MSKWYQRGYRRSLVDMHIEAWNDEFLSQFDPGKYVELLKEANIQSAMLYINSHARYCYWRPKRVAFINAAGIIMPINRIRSNLYLISG